jgi:hypothetical protein
LCRPPRVRASGLSFLLIMPDSMLDLISLSVVGHPLALNATCAERRAYREDVLQLPGPIDRWLTANSRCPRIWFLRDYLMLANVQEEYVTCFVERECVMVSTAPLNIF